jgi:hypothetical protein
MLLQQVEVPSPERYVDFPDAHGSAMALVPEGQLIGAELQYWRVRARSPRPEEPEVMSSIAGYLAEQLRVVATGRVVYDEVIHRDAHEISDPRIGSWYLDCLLYMGYAAIIRELEAVDPANALSGNPETDEPEVVIDVDEQAPENSGVHIADSHLRSVLGLEPPDPGVPGCYEGERTFLLASKPAALTIHTGQQYQSHFGRPFDGSKYTSLRPRLKIGYWTK